MKVKESENKKDIKVRRDQRSENDADGGVFFVFIFNLKKKKKKKRSIMDNMDVWLLKL